MFNALRVFAITLVFLIASCGGSSGDSDSASPNESSDNLARLDTVEFTLSYIDFDTFSILDRPLVSGNRLQFPFIAGQLAGDTSLENLIDAQVDRTNKVSITFDRSIFTDTTRPEMLSSEAAELGLTIQPADTLFGRLGQFGVDASGQEIPTDVGYALYDDLSDTLFSILYFSQAAVLSGSIESIEGNFVYDIVVPEEGFYAVGNFNSEDVDGTLLQTSRVIDIFDEAFFGIFE